MKISGFSPFPVPASTCLSDLFAPKERQFDKTTFEAKTKVRKPEEKDEIDEIRISPFTKCMVADFG